MGVCAHCGTEESMPFTCKFCGEKYCANHHLPENHDCIGLERFKEERSKMPERWIYEPFHERYKRAAGREVEKPLVQRLIDYARGLDKEKILRLILAFIGLVLLVELARLLL